MCDAARGLKASGTTTGAVASTLSGNCAADEAQTLTKSADADAQGSTSAHSFTATESACAAATAGLFRVLKREGLLLFGVESAAARLAPAPPRNEMWIDRPVGYSRQQTDYAQHCGFD